MPNTTAVADVNVDYWCDTRLLTEPDACRTRSWGCWQYYSLHAITR